MATGKMNIRMFTSWRVRCGIAEYAAQLVHGLRMLPDTEINLVPFDRQPHPRSDYTAWGQMMNKGDVAHIQHEYTFFGYLLPWRNHYGPFTRQIYKPIVITRHVSFDGPLRLDEHGPGGLIRQIKWAMYNRWLGPYATFLNRDTFDIARQIIVLTAPLKEQLIARGIRPDKINVIRSGVPELPPAVGGEALRTEWNWTRKRVLGIFGFITPAKGHLVALDALAQLPDDYVLLIAGGLRREQDRPVLAALERRIRALELTGRVRITGYLAATDIPAHIGACDMLVYPYTHADFSTSVVWGLAYQHVPVVISDIPTHRDLADWCGCIELFNSGDAAHLAHVVQQLAGAPARQEALRQAAHRWAQANSWTAIAQQTREVYARAIQS